MRLNTMGRTFRAVVLIGAVLGVSAPRAGADAIRYNYNVTDLGSLPGGTDYTPRGINASGQVVGTYGISQGAGSIGGSFLYSGGRMVDTSGSGASGYGINDAGRTTTGTDRAINNVGQTVGSGFGGGGDPTGYLSAGGVKAPLPINFDPLAVNDHATVAGRAMDQNAVGHAAIYSNGQITVLGQTFGTEANAINGAGQVVGGPFMYAGHAFSYDGSGLHDLGTLGGSTSTAWGLNASGQIVGESLLTGVNGRDAGLHAFLDQGGKMFDLNTLVPPTTGWVLNSATAINDSGQIIGRGVYNGEDRGFLLTPVPEPSTLAAFGLVAAALAKGRLNQGLCAAAKIVRMQA